ncbi:MAG: histidine kinase [Caldimonas sp.]
MASEHLSAKAPASVARSFVQALTWQRAAVAVGLAVFVATALNPIFVIPYPVLLGRLLAIAALLLLAFTAAGVWQPPGVPRWLNQVLAVVVAAPIATLLAYLPSINGDLRAIFDQEGRILGFIWITGTTLLIAPLLALGALYRERDAQARSERLAFALERSTLEKQALDARLKLLNAQIEPHFLFNTLANVQELVESGSAQAAPVLRNLIAYLRAAMPKLHDSASTLADEVSLVRAYLELMHMRMPDRLRFAIDVPDELARASFPPMGLLTLVENAIRHGIDPSENGGRIEVRASRSPATAEVHVAVVDTGAGMAESALPGTGLENLRSRLRAFFGPLARLELHEHEPHGLRAEIVFEPGAGAPA